MPCSFGASLTFCQIERSDAERRVRQMARNIRRSTVRQLGEDLRAEIPLKHTWAVAPREEGG